MNVRTPDARLIEDDAFPFEFLSRLAERESWRKEVHRPIYHVHKWWAKRLGSVFRGILLGCALPTDANLEREFYRTQAFTGQSVLDPFMGSGTTVGEAHKLGFTALGRDINPVAVEAVATAFGPMDRGRILEAFDCLSEGVGERIRKLYQSHDSRGRPCDVLYHFWVMQTNCPGCRRVIDLFPSYVIARNAYPDRKPEVQIVCPACGGIARGLRGQQPAPCQACGHAFDPDRGPAHGPRATCPDCQETFVILDAIGDAPNRPDFRQFASLVLTPDGGKEYLPTSEGDLAMYAEASATLRRECAAGTIALPDLSLEDGHNTRQATRYGFRKWRDFFNDRQLLALGWLRSAIDEIPHATTRRALLTLFSGVLEFNNLFASYKGEGTGAVRHMFSHHILKPERTPIEANVWGTPKSSGSFRTLFRGRLLRALDYRDAPTEVNGQHGAARQCSPAFSGQLESTWPSDGQFAPRGIYLSRGDSAHADLPAGSVDLVVTDPPFFDNVHYSELADFFFAWQQLSGTSIQGRVTTTRSPAEVQDADAGRFAAKLAEVFAECRRTLKPDGLLAFSYHHSRDDGWQALARAIIEAGFTVTNSQPMKAEMSVATPKSQAKDPIQLDIVIICRPNSEVVAFRGASLAQAIDRAISKIRRLEEAGFKLSRNDRRIVIFGQLLTTVHNIEDAERLGEHLDAAMALADVERPVRSRGAGQQVMFDGG